MISKIPPPPLTPTSTLHFTSPQSRLIIMAAHWWILRAVMAFEDRIVELILRRPGFHRAVGRIHRTIHEHQHGRNPHEPLAPGEATGMLHLLRELFPEI